MITLYIQRYFFDKEGNFLISYAYGNYGFLQHEKMKNQPLILLDMGIEKRCHENYCFDNAKRAPYSGYVLQFTLSGYGVFKHAQKQYLLTKDTGFLCHIPGKSCYCLPDTSYPSEYADAGWEFFYIHFDGPAAKPFYQTLLSLSGPTFTLPQDCPPIQLFFRLFKECSQQGSLDLYEGGEFLYRFLSQLLRELESPTANHSLLIQHAKNYMRTHFQTIESTRDIADYCQISQEHLTRCFHTETGHTPLQFLTKLRIEYALFLLLNTNDSIQQIATSCGFQTGNYFAKVFRKYLHCSPEEYRKMYSCH